MACDGFTAMDPRVLQNHDDMQMSCGAKGEPDGEEMGYDPNDDGKTIDSGSGFPRSRSAPLPGPAHSHSFE